jgi:hypothetical protein
MCFQQKICIVTSKTSTTGRGGGVGSTICIAFYPLRNEGLPNDFFHEQGLWGCKETFKLLRITNSLIEAEETPLVLLPARVVLDKIQVT